MLLLPLTLSQQKSARKMQEFQPEVNKLKKKYAKDQERLNRELQKLYQEAGINPLAGCLPLLLQFPIWLGLYRAIVYCVPATPMQLFEFSQNIYSWLPGVNGVVPLQSTFLGMDLGLPPNAVQWWSYSLPVLVFATSILQQKLITPPTSGDDQSQTAVMNKQMQVMMPLMFMFFTLSYATGLSIYFIISNLIRIVQYYVIQVINKREQASSKP
jgi:YidC/Oxa1 family membrane protein insertase